MSFDKVNISLVQGLGLMLVTARNQVDGRKVRSGCDYNSRGRLWNRCSKQSEESKELFSDGKDVAILL